MTRAKWSQASGQRERERVWEKEVELMLTIGLTKDVLRQWMTSSSNTKSDTHGSQQTLKHYGQSTWWLYVAEIFSMGLCG